MAGCYALNVVMGVRVPPRQPVSKERHETKRHAFHCLHTLLSVGAPGCGSISLVPNAHELQVSVTNGCPTYTPKGGTRTAIFVVTTKVSGLQEEYTACRW